MTAMLVATAGNVVPVTFPLEDGEWNQWLEGQIDPRWRPGEWSRRSWMFTGDPENPRTSVERCVVAACTNTVQSGMCHSCRRILTATGQDRAEFLLSHVPDRRTVTAAHGGERREACLVERDGVRCGRLATKRDVCRAHYRAWHHARSRSGDSCPPLAQWLITVAEPLPRLADCLVAGCGTPRDGGHGLCVFHRGRWSAVPSEARGPADEWATSQLPYLGMDRFSLVQLAPLVRLEVLLGLQDRDRLGLPVSPYKMQRVLDKLIGCPTLVGRHDQMAEVFRASKPSAIARQLCWSVQLAFEEFSGVRASDKNVLDVRAIRAGRLSAARLRTQLGVKDLTLIRQFWLRDLLREWVIATRPGSKEFGRVWRPVLMASRTLMLRPGGGHDPAALSYADMTAITQTFKTCVKADGTPYTSQTRRIDQGAFCGLLDFGRAAGLLDTMPGSFAKVSAHRIPADERNEDEVGKAVPEHVISQLDQHVAALGAGIAHGSMSTEDVAAMCRTLYVILRDTGRRPGEVAALPIDCLETVDGEISLIWDNRKRRRHRRRLPITSDTAHAIQSWQQHRRALPTPDRSSRYLFPAISNASTYPHMNPGFPAIVIRSWVDGLAELHDEGVDAAGDPLPFDRAKAHPYAFRHAYAQRHADAGTPVDVLKELMDHTAVQVTMGYFQVSLKRKRAAVKTLAAHVIDRSGRPAPFGSSLAYERSSVAVPFGGCVEPSNVKAGGKACPIRFQCAGCAFYRPDPSYLPAIEQQINDLKVDRETAEAMDAAQYVIGNLSDQVAAYTDVAATMRRRLAELPAAERAEIEEASTVMRRARATAAHTLLPLTTAKGDDEEGR